MDDIDKLKTWIHASIGQGISLDLIINDNRSTVLNVLKHEPEYIKVSVHKMFLKAPIKVKRALGSYIKDPKTKDEGVHSTLNSFIQKKIDSIDYSHRVRTLKLDSKGKVYDLRRVFTYLNRQYFNSTLDMSISWFGRGHKKGTNCHTLGYYCNSMNLIKIHRALDKRSIPAFYLYFVVYHEMVHSLVPGRINSRGQWIIHGPEFKRKEKKFVKYKQATEWEKANAHVFRGNQ